MPSSAQPIERKLAAIFAADVAGYSRLMGQDEVGTMRTLTAHREVMGRVQNPEPIRRQCDGACRIYLTQDEDTGEDRCDQQKRSRRRPRAGGLRSPKNTNDHARFRTSCAEKVAVARDRLGVSLGRPSTRQKRERHQPIEHRPHRPE